MHYTKKRYFWILVSLYLLNDLIYLNSQDYLVWLLTDYAVRIITIFTLFVLYKEYIIDKKMFYFGNYPLKDTVVVGGLFSIAGVLIFTIIEANFSSINFYKGISSPDIPYKALEWFDLTVGLLLVSISEEVLFHAYFFALFKERFTHNQLILSSALLFAAIHWSNDMTNILGVFIWGLIAMQIFIKTKSIWPLVLAHTVTNFVLFTEIVDENYFKGWF